MDPSKPPSGAHGARAGAGAGAGAGGSTVATPSPRPILRKSTTLPPPARVSTPRQQSAGNDSVQLEPTSRAGMHPRALPPSVPYLTSASQVPARLEQLSSAASLRTPSLSNAQPGAATTGPGGMGRDQFDVVVVIALAEEAKAFMEGLPRVRVGDTVGITSLENWEHYQAPGINYTMYHTRIVMPPNALCDVRTKSGGSRSATEVVHKSLFIRMLVACLGDMGEEPMAVATTCLVERFAPAVCINTGITGSLDSDLKIGDVMVPAQVINYSSNSKVTDTPAGATQGSGPTYDLVLGSRAFSLPRKIRSRLRRFNLAGGEIAAWQKECQVASQPQLFDQLDKVLDDKDPEPLYEQAQVVDKHLSRRPAFHIANLGSGNVLVASKAFKRRIRDMDRKMAACEMEVGGFLQAAVASHGLRGTLFVPIRGISDPADGDKRMIEGFFHGARCRITGREYCMHNVARLTHRLLVTGTIPALPPHVVDYMLDRAAPIQHTIRRAQADWSRRRSQEPTEVHMRVTTDGEFVATPVAAGAAAAARASVASAPAAAAASATGVSRPAGAPLDDTGRPKKRMRGGYTSGTAPPRMESLPRAASWSTGSATATLNKGPAPGFHAKVLLPQSAALKLAKVVPGGEGKQQDAVISVSDLLAAQRAQFVELLASNLEPWDEEAAPSSVDTLVWLSPATADSTRGSLMANLHRYNTTVALLNDMHPGLALEELTMQRLVEAVAQRMGCPVPLWRSEGQDY